MDKSIPIAVRSSSGISVNLGPPEYGNLSLFPPDVSKSCRTMVFSADGRFFSWVNGKSLNLVSTSDWSTIAEIASPRVFSITFSPKGSYLMTWEPFTVSNANPQGSPNLHLYKTEDGSLVKSFIHKKQTNWEPQWSADEHLCVRMVNTDIIFYEAANFERIQKRINCFKVASFSLSPTISPYYVLCHMPGANGQPSFGRMFKYPNFEAQQAVAVKSFFQADKVEFYWNCTGKNALLLTTLEVDKSGGSYYGKQSLHYCSITGETSMVSLSKDGPIYDIAWSPKGGTEFCVMYGFMPSKATIFNLKCEPVFEFGTGPRNAIHYNPHGNILLVGGFGNLRGQVETWDIQQRKLIGKCEAPDSTLLHWSPDGEHFITATTAPRLRIGNGYKIWHYTGSLLHELPWDKEEELYDVCWLNKPKGTYKEPTITEKKIEGIATSQPQASKVAYRPPSARNRPPVAFRLHDDEDDGPQNKSTNASKPTKNALKLKKKREARKQRKQDEASAANEEDDEAGGEGEGGNAVSTKPVTSSVAVKLTGDAEKDKKIKNLKKKLDAISKLKEQRDQGKPLEINQLAKIKGEVDLIKELDELQL